MITKSSAVVTGATGHIGNVLVRELLNRGIPVRAMLFPGEDASSLAELDVECVESDVRCLDTLYSAFEGASMVYHLAGLVSIRPGCRRALHEVNVVGTRNVICACRECGISRLVYVSSVHALVEPPRGTKITETAGCDPSQTHGPYARSKARATREVLDAIARGLDAVIVFPTGVVGPYDFKISEMGRLILDFACCRLPAYVQGAYDFVDVRDVADGIIAAGERGRKGEGYLLSGELLPVSRMMALLETCTGVRAPSLVLPQWAARIGALFAPMWSRITGTPPRFTRYSLYVLRSNSLMDCSKACRELGYAPRPLTVSLADAVEWFHASGYWPHEI